MLYLLNIYRNLCVQFFIRVRVGCGDRKRELSHNRFRRVRRVNGKEKREKRGKKVKKEEEREEGEEEKGRVFLVLYFSEYAI